MTYTYQQIKLSDNSTSDWMIKRLPDYAFIPSDASNTDYQAYLKWVSEGNTPEPAEA